MELDSNLLKEFVKMTNDSEVKTETKYLRGTIVKNSGGKYVQLDGSTTATPISEIIDVEEGDRVLVTIENHKATIVGNFSFPPSARKEQEALDKSNAAQNAANQAGETANSAQIKAREASDKADEAMGLSSIASASANEAKQQASEAISKANSAQENIQEAKDLASQANTASTEAKNQAAQSQAASADAQAKVAELQNEVNEAKGNIDDALAELESQAGEIAGIKEEYALSVEVENAKAEMTTEITKKVGELETKVTKDYATKTENVELEGRLQTQITQNAEGFASQAAKIEKLEGDTAEAQKDVDEALTKAAAAQTTATEAQTKAQAAQDAADAATADANSAAEKAQLAQNAAADATAAANAADKAVQEAQGDLDEAKQNLATVTSRVDATEEEIANAQAKVDAAQEAVNGALADAAEARVAADNATQAATKAQQDAETAKGVANTAQQKADNAKTAADNAQAAADKAQEDVAALTKRVTTAETNIEQNSEKIELNATKTEEIGDALKNDYYKKTETEALIKVESDKIESTVKRVETVEKDFENLEIGGTNLIRGTNSVTKLTTNGSWNNGTWRAASSGTGTRTSIEVTDSPNSNIKVGWHITSTEGQVMIAQDFVPTSNEQEYTMSCYAKGSGKVELQYGNANVGYQYKQIELNSDTEWVKCSYTFKSKGEGNVYFGANGDDGVNFTDSDVCICGMKLEKGTIATDWSPSIDNMIIGGRNLLIGTSTIKTFNINESEGYTVHDPYSTNEKQTLADLGLKAGDEVAISFDWNISQNGDLDIVYGNFRIEWYGIKNNVDNYLGVIENPVAVFSSTNTSGKAKIITTLTDDVLAAHTVRFRVDNSVLNLTISKMKLEIGNSNTDWTPAPEDIDSDISDAQSKASNAETVANNAQKQVTVAQSTIQQLSNMIANLVTDANGTSLMTQTPNGWTFNMSDINANLSTLGKEMDAVESGQKDTNDALTKLTNLVNSVEAKTAYITLGKDDSGNPCIELGKTTNDFKVRITNTAIDFLEGSTKIAYVNNKTFYAEKMIVKNELQIGNGPAFVWRTRANGNMGLVYISG